MDWKTNTLVNKSLLVGRSRKCDLTLADGRTSRQQARFFTGPDQDLWVEDLNSLKWNTV